MCDRHKTNQTYDHTIPLNKADDWTRRAFINRAALFMSLFGVGWLPRMELLEGLSKKIFGSATAFANSGSSGFTLYMSWGMRMGFPDGNLLGDLQDTMGSANPDRNFHAQPGVTQLIAKQGTMNQPLILPPQVFTTIDPVAGTITPVGGKRPFVERIARLTSIKTAGGHQNRSPYLSSASGRKGADVGVLVSHASTMHGMRPVSVTSPIAFGDINDFDYGPTGLLSEFTPSYVNSLDDVLGLFRSIELKDSTGQALPKGVVDGIYAAQEKLNKETIAKLSSRQGYDAIKAGNEAMQALLKQNLVDSLDPDKDPTVQQIVTDLTTDVTLPDDRFDVGDTSIAEQCAVMIRGMQLGLWNSSGHTFQTGDWHTSRAGADGTNNQGKGTTPEGTDTIQAQWASFFGTFVPKLLNVLDGLTFSDSSATMGDKFVLSLNSEFARTIGGSKSDNGDNSHGGKIIVGAHVAGGVYGNHNASLDNLMPDLTSGNATQTGQLDPQVAIHTERAILGLEHDPSYVLKAMIDT